MLIVTNALKIVLEICLMIIHVNALNIILKKLYQILFVENAIIHVETVQGNYQVNV